MYFLPATMFLEFWKRRQAEIAYEWDLLGYEDEEVLHATQHQSPSTGEINMTRAFCAQCHLLTFQP